ncbi:DUF1501 domain-containing protein [Crateriforma conspicua]|uniref:DUF1501 domain-containing protein n=1 Tax=Crateriforma conspicua TaxID=2527996 RepID=A0A5C6FQW5_9PLAN|nr:DUF1501 domain-containing protein [Crateriforma conspicua]TWU62883.1 hypothetical protein V7x_46200 [Crateriforma conspicua]
MKRQSREATLSGMNSPQLDPLSRRNFLKWSGGCASLSSTAILSQILNLQLTQSVAADTTGGSDYKALVCVFLLGGVDSYNMITPHVQSEYDAYAGIRTNLALPREDLLSIPMDSSSPGGRTLGIHPGMPEMQTLYNEGNAAVVANVGSLVFPTDRSNYSTVKLPLGLFSHSDLIKHWQTSVPQSRSQVTGWGGRMADILNATTNDNPNIAMNIALGSLNVFQTGGQIVPYVVNTNGATPLYGYGNNNARDRVYRRVIDHMYPSTADSELGQIYSDLLQRTLAKTKRVSIDAADAFNSATDVTLNTTFPAENRLAENLEMVAKTIAGRQTLGQGRQIFFVSAGGWDHHDEVIDNQAAMLPQVSQALHAFYRATEELGVADCVTTFTASDFARTLSSNGNGSDHAWGGNHFVIGGAVRGGNTYGDYPESLALNNDLDVGRGRLIPTTSVDEYNAELAMWFGIPNNQTLQDVLPNIRNFYASGGSSAPIGFLA